MKNNKLIKKEKLAEITQLAIMPEYDKTTIYYKNTYQNKYNNKLTEIISKKNKKEQ